MTGRSHAPAPTVRSFRLVLALATVSLAWGCGSDESCASRADCAAGESCTEGSCVEDPECRDDVDCPGTEQCVDLACEPGSLDLEGRFPSDPPPGYEVVDLGEVEVLEGETPDLTFEIEPEVRALRSADVMLQHPEEALARGHAQGRAARERALAR